MGQTENWKAEKCVSAIELRYLCKNEKYEVPEEVGIPLGFGAFWEKLCPVYRRLLMWTELITNQDIKCFLEKINYFVDSCIKEIKYVSGSYSENGKSLYAINDNRNLHILFHSISGCYPAFEVRFSKIHKLILEPCSDEQDSVIYDSTLIKKDNLFYWFDYKEEDICSFVPNGTAVIAEKVSWRPINNFLGKEDFYYSKLK